MKIRLLLLGLSLAATAPAQDAVSRLARASQAPLFDPAQGWVSLFNRENLDGWKPLDPTKENAWMTAQQVTLDPGNPKRFHILKFAHLRADDPGPSLVNGESGKTVDILSDYEHGDVEMYVDFAVAEGSNSGVYFQSLYEVQIRDSFGKTDLDDHDAGAIYGRRAGKQKIPGVAPKVNASRAPGEWQSYHIWFRAPRFDGRGRKVANARFEKVVYNGTVIHENVEMQGPTQGKIQGPERARGPFLIQGDHGPVAFRRIMVRPLP